MLGPGGGTAPDARQMEPASGKGMQNGQDLHEQVSLFLEGVGAVGQLEGSYMTPGWNPTPRS